MSTTPSVCEHYALKMALKKSILWLNEFEKSSIMRVTMNISLLKTLRSHEIKKHVQLFNLACSELT